MSKTIPPACPIPDTGPKYWRSLDEVSDTPAFRAWVEREFPAGASEMLDPVNRRSFMKLMSASFMLAGVGLTGCRRPVEKIEPFSKMPEDYVHGVARFYATARPVRGSAVPLLAKSHEGRPVKVEGNAEHPLFDPSATGLDRRQAGTDLFTQASILNLYDPDRAQRFANQGKNTTREKALDQLDAIARTAQGNQGKGLAFLLERSSSPSRARLEAGLRQRLPQARWFVHEPVDFDIHRQAASLAFGQPVKPVYQLAKAKRILSLDCDFLGIEEDSFRTIGGFAQGRRLRQSGDDMNRLYAVEALHSVTGTNADHRLRLAPSQIQPFTYLLFAEFIEQSGEGAKNSEAASFAKILRERSAVVPAEPRVWAKACVKDLIAGGAQSIVLAGYRQPLAVHLLAHAFNFYLQSAQGPVLYVEAPAPALDSVVDLAKALQAGEVETLVILGPNPAYDAPADLDWAKSQRKAKTVVRLGDYEDETSVDVDWHLPRAHYLESWGDARTGDGTVVPIQPLIEPMFGGMTDIEVLARIGQLPERKPYDIARATFRELAGGGEFEEAWKKFLHDGYLAGSAAKPVAPRAVAWGKVSTLVMGAELLPAPSASKLEVAFVPDYSAEDGRFNNNGWLQELPDPISKIVWDNVICLSRKTAEELGVVVVDENRMRLKVPVVRLSAGNRTIEGPAWIQPGLADNVAVVSLGYGRAAVGRVGRGTGYNAYPLRSSKGLHVEGGVQLTKTDKRYPLSCTQNHWYMQGRPVIREANLETYRKDPHFAKAYDMHEPPGERDAQGRPKPIYPNPLDAKKEASTHQWGMSIDLNTCVGCSACVIACQSENNIPIVGKDLVNRGREMHWIRIDRYFLHPIDDPQVVSQPMLCQHCEAAPCESVCPVNATVHDQEGLNVMAYNRCVGTRYCSNNCPYKVRRFNFLDYNRRSLEQLKGPFFSSPLVSTTDGEWTLKRWFKDRDRGIRPQDEWDLLKLAKNPEVTVRMRGVMEKCSFCVQRIEGAKIAQKVKAGASNDVMVRDGVIQTACQQVCPAGAIEFGNLKDPASRVVQAKASDRTYEVLEFLATKPRVTYQARVRNPNPEMPGYQAQPASAREYIEAGNRLEGHAAHGSEGAAAHGSSGHEAAKPAQHEGAH